MRYVATNEMLAPIIAAIDKTFTITSIVDNTLFSYTLNTCNTLWASLNFVVTIGGNQYTITSFVPNVSITIQGTVALSLLTTSFQLYAPVFYFGSLKATEYDFEKKINNQLLQTDRLPMIWLHTPTDEQVDENPLKPIGMRSNCELYFMINSEFSAWDNQDHFLYAIKPMRNLIQAFMNAVNAATTLNPMLIQNSGPRDLPKFHTYTGKDNKESTIFSSPMSGCGLNIELPFFKLKDLCC